MTTQDLDALLDDADFATIDVPVCLKGSLNVEWENANQALAAAQTEFDAAVSAKANTAQYSRARDVALAALQDVEERMNASTIVFTLSQISDEAWNAVILKHPPREGVDIDQAAGYNRVTIAHPLIRAALTAPVMSDKQWETTRKLLTHRYTEQLLGAALKLNREMSGQIPFSLAAFIATQNSDATSTRPAPSASPRAASGAGRRSKSRGKS